MIKYNAVCISTTGAPGSGKTYSRCAKFLVDWWLPEEKGDHWSNFPINMEALEKRHPGASQRVFVIPDDELKSWRDFESETPRGPWDFFKDYDLTGAHIAIDECHKWLPRAGKGNQKNAKRWEDWLSEIRHRKCTVEFLSQDPQKVNKVVDFVSTVRINLVNSEDKRDPLFSILMGDWYEVGAYFGGTYETTIWQTESRRINGKWIEGEITRFKLTPDYYEFYNSYNVETSSDNKPVENPREFQKRGRVVFWWWFFKRNWFRLSSRLALACVVFWLCFFGGMTFVINEFLAYIKTRSAPPVAKNEEKPEVKKITTTKTVSQGKEISPADAFHRETTDLAAIAGGDKVKKPNIETVRSETLAHKSLENPPSAEAQQKALPRVALVSADFISLDDGQLLMVGEKLNEWSLYSIEYQRRRATFCEGEGDEKTFLVVPVGGPVGQRVRKQEEPKQSIGIVDSVQGLLP